MNLQSFLTGSREMWFSLLQISFAWINQDPSLRALRSNKNSKFEIQSFLNSFQPLTIITKYSILDVTGALDQPLLINNITFAPILLNLELTN